MANKNLGNQPFALISKLHHALRKKRLSQAKENS